MLACPHFRPAFTLCALPPIIPTLLPAFMQEALKYAASIRVGFTHTHTRVHHKLHISFVAIETTELLGWGPQHCSTDEKKYRSPTGKVAT
jgi:hypothetical protein